VPSVGDHGERIIVICAQGFQSSLAAANLQEMGMINATDVIGGFEAWAAAGLPIQPADSGNTRTVH
jgi:rhodanese-related sulfurtransferase